MTPERRKVNWFPLFLQTSVLLLGIFGAVVGYTRSEENRITALEVKVKVDEQARNDLQVSIHDIQRTLALQLKSQERSNVLLEFIVQRHKLEDEKKAEAIVKDLTEIMPGRSTVIEHRHPFDTIRKHYNKDTADAITKLHVSTITAAEQQTMNFYMNVGNRIIDETGRGLYQEIAEIEEQHVTHYGALEDPRASWFEMAVLHEYNECYMYWSCMESEVDSRVKMLWQRCLENEIAHLHVAVDMMKQFEKKDAIEQYPRSFPEPLVLTSSKDYVRQVIADQFQLTTDQTQFVPLSNAENRDRYAMYQSKVNGGAYVPSQQVIVNTIQTKGQDYRLETQGQSPLDILRDRKGAPDREKIIRYCLSK